MYIPRYLLELTVLYTTVHITRYISKLAVLYSVQCTQQDHLEHKELAVRDPNVDPTDRRQVWEAPSHTCSTAGPLPPPLQPGESRRYFRYMSKLTVTIYIRVLDSVHNNIYTYQSQQYCTLQCT